MTKEMKRIMLEMQEEMEAAREFYEQDGEFHSDDYELCCGQIEDWYREQYPEYF